MDKGLQFAGLSGAEGNEQSAEVITVCLNCKRGQELYTDMDETSDVFLRILRTSRAFCGNLMKFSGLFQFRLLLGCQLLQFVERYGLFGGQYVAEIFIILFNDSVLFKLLKLYGHLNDQFTALDTFDVSHDLKNTFNLMLQCLKLVLLTNTFTYLHIFFTKLKFYYIVL